MCESSPCASLIGSFCWCDPEFFSQGREEALAGAGVAQKEVSRLGTSTTRSVDQDLPEVSRQCELQQVGGDLAEDLGSCASLSHTTGLRSHDVVEGSRAERFEGQMSRSAATTSSGPKAHHEVISMGAISPTTLGSTDSAMHSGSCRRVCENSSSVVGRGCSGDNPHAGLGENK